MAVPHTPEGVDVEFPEGVSAEFISFLKTVDAPDVRPLELLCNVALAFINNGIGSKLEMVGVERGDICTSTLRVVLHVHIASCLFVWPDGFALSAGAKALVRRGICAANTSLVVAASGAASSDGPSTDGNSVRDLVNVIKKEEVTVTIDLFTCINVCFRCLVLLAMFVMCLLSCRALSWRVCLIPVSPPRKQRTNSRPCGRAI